MIMITMHFFWKSIKTFLSQKLLQTTLFKSVLWKLIIELHDDLAHLCFSKYWETTTSSAIAIMSLTDTNGTCTSSILPTIKNPLKICLKGELNVSLLKFRYFEKATKIENSPICFWNHLVTLSQSGIFFQFFCGSLRMSELEGTIQRGRSFLTLYLSLNTLTFSQGIWLHDDFGPVSLIFFWKGAGSMNRNFTFVNEIFNFLIRNFEHIVCNHLKETRGTFMKKQERKQSCAATSISPIVRTVMEFLNWGYKISLNLSIKLMCFKKIALFCELT